MKYPILAMFAGLGVATLAAIAAAAQTNQTSQYDQTQRTIRDHADLEMSAAPRLDHEQILQLQLLLQEKGFKPGSPDGIFGPRTKEALRDFQDRYGIKVSGVFDNQTLYALGRPEYAGP
jgi:peptidoglycan hydrolase-like protein with peptidoglycan-binding domain